MIHSNPDTVMSFQDTKIYWRICKTFNGDFLLKACKRLNLCGNLFLLLIVNTSISRVTLATYHWLFQARLYLLKLYVKNDSL